MIFNPVTYVYFKEPILEELTVTTNGEYTPSASNVSISKVVVDIPIPKLTTPAIRQEGNFILVLNENGWWGNRIHFYKDNAYYQTREYNYLNLDTCFSEFESGNFYAQITYERPDPSTPGPTFTASDISNTIGCMRKYYTPCKLEFVTDHFIVTGVYDTEVDSLVIPPLAELENQVFPITEIAENAFKDLKKLMSVAGERIEIIHANAFSGCDILQTAEFPILKKIVGKEIFAQTMINELDLSMLDLIASSDMLKGNSVPIKLSMPSSPEQYYIPPYLFNNAKLQDLKLPENIKRIDEYAFKDASIKFLTITSKEISFSPSAFVASPFANNTGMVFVDYNALEKVFTENNNLPLLGCFIITEGDITIKGVKTYNGKSYAFQLFYTEEDAFNIQNPLNNQGEDYVSIGLQQYFARITELG